MVNVARGGTLHQHLPDEVGERVRHRQSERAEEPTHSIAIAPGSLLEQVVGDRILDVNSFHHQSVWKLGDGLLSTAWAPDGTVEAFEGVDERFLLGVQWHAEGLTDYPRHAALFDAFVRASRSPAPTRQAERALARVQEPG